MTAQVLSREMGITHADFFRLLPQVLAGRCWRRNGATVVVTEELRRLTIQLAPEAERRIASLRLPVTRVTLAFSGYNEQDSAAFMARLERYFGSLVIRVARIILIYMKIIQLVVTA